jgi:hypothetical protein
MDVLQRNYKESVQGQSLYPLIQNPDSYDRRHVFCEAVNQNCVRSLVYKFTDSNELFLYESDPGEQFNQADKQKELCVTGAHLLAQFVEQCQALHIEKGLHKSDEVVNLTEEDINKLRALGYIQ